MENLFFIFLFLSISLTFAAKKVEKEFKSLLRVKYPSVWDDLDFSEGLSDNEINDHFRFSGFMIKRKYKDLSPDLVTLGNQLLLFSLIASTFVVFTLFIFIHILNK